MQHVRRPQGCVSDLVLDELIAGVAIDAAVQAHLSGCARCTARREALSEQREHFLRAAPSFAAHAALAGAPAPVQPVASIRPPRRLVLGGALGALAMAAAVMLMLRGRERAVEPEDYLSYETRTKGAPRLGMFIKRDGQVQRAAPSAHVRGGDLLRFTYSSHTPRYLALLNVEGNIARVYYPATKVAAGQDVALDFSVEQDASREREGVLAVFCDKPFDAEPLRKALAEDGELPELGADCALDSITLEKAAP